MFSFRHVAILLSFKGPLALHLFQRHDALRVPCLAPLGSECRGIQASFQWFTIKANLDDEGKSLSFTQAHRIRIMFQVSRAISNLHSGDGGPLRYTFFHRGIKSANIYLMEDWTANLIDGGCANFIEIGEVPAAGSLIRTVSEPRRRCFLVLPAISASGMKSSGTQQ